MHLVTDLPLNYVENEEEIVKIKSFERNLKSKKSSINLVYGYNNSGKHSFVYKTLSNIKEENSKIIEISSSEIIEENKIISKKLQKILRLSSTITVKETTKIVIGEVVSIIDNKLYLRTRDMETVFEIGFRLKEELQKERVVEGDIIQIYKEYGYVTRIGKVKDVLPSNIGSMNGLVEGECIRNEHITTNLSLDELDIINCNENGEDNLYKNIYVSERIQNEVDKSVNKWIKETKAFFTRGFLIINNSELLNNENFENIVELSKIFFSPHIILIFNGIPEFENKGELRFFIQPKNYKEIIKMNAEDNNITINDDALEILVKLTSKIPLTKILNILNAANISNVVSFESINRILFLYDF